MSKKIGSNMFKEIKLMKMKPLRMVVLMAVVGACSGSSLEGTDARGSDPSPQPSASSNPSATTTATTTPTASATTTIPTASATTSPQPSPEGEFTMLFQDFTVKEGLDIGNALNLRFALDLQSKVQIFKKPSQGWSMHEGKLNAKTIRSYELGGACGLDVKHLGPVELPAGDPAWVKSVDLTLSSFTATPSDGSEPEPNEYYTMCYGYRMNGVWYWELANTYATWHPETETYHVHFTIEKGPVDAIKILTNNGSERALQRLVFSTKAM